MSKIGVCHFDDPKVAKAGWASINGTESVRIKNRGELRSDVLWITNVLWRDYRKLNLNKLSHIVDDQFFRTSYTLYGRELGFIDEPDKQAQFFSSVFSLFSTYAKEKLEISIKDCDYRVTTMLRDYLLNKKYFQQPKTENVLSLKNAFAESYQAIQVMTGAAPIGTKTFNFNFPRGAYSRWLLGLKYPSSNAWKELPAQRFRGTFGFEDNIMIKGTKTILSELKNMSLTKAGFFRISVLSQNQDFIGFQAFGSGSNQRRSWVSLPELIYISRFSKIKIEGGFVSELGDIELNLNLNKDENEFSITRSIFLDCLWVGIASPLSNARKEHTAISAYLRAYDRIACAKAAEAFYKEGSITVGSFGTGRVTAYLRPSELELANQIAISNGLLPSFQQMVN